MKRTTIVAAAAMISSSCLVHKPQKNPPPPLPVPQAYQQGAAGSPLPEKWWEDFGDPQLNQLIEQALAGNFQVTAAWARIDQASAIASQASSGKWPQLQVSGMAARQRSFTGSFASPVPGFEIADHRTSNAYSLSVGAGYELDLWKRVGSQAKSAALASRASRDDLEAIAITLAAEVSEAYFDALFRREQAAMFAGQLETDETFEELVMLRFQQGLGASSLDVFQARQQATSTRAQLVLVQGLATVAEYRLAVLIGKVPGAVALPEAAKLPSLPALPGAGVPADLLLRRPDVRAMQRRVEAADWRVASAVADRLPSLSISGSVGLNHSSFVDLFTSPVYNLAANLLGPLFDGGRRAAVANQSRAVVTELLASYGQVLLQAMLEVESALVLERHQHSYIVELERQVDLGRSTLSEARGRYREGIDSFLPVLTSLTTLHRGEQNLLTAQRQLLSYRVQLCRALGGTWTSELRKPS